MVHMGSDSKSTQNFLVNNFLRKRTNEGPGGGVTCIWEDKKGVKWDVKVWAEFKWAKAWPQVKSSMNIRFSIKNEIIHLLDVLVSHKILVAMLSGSWPLQQRIIWAEVRQHCCTSRVTVMLLQT